MSKRRMDPLPDQDDALAALMRLKDFFYRSELHPCGLTWNYEDWDWVCIQTYDPHLEEYLAKLWNI